MLRQTGPSDSAPGRVTRVFKVTLEVSQAATSFVSAECTRKKALSDQLSPPIRIKTLFLLGAGVTVACDVSLRLPVSSAPPCGYWT